METLKKLRNRIFIVLATLNVLLPFVVVCSARVSALMIMLSDSPWERIRKWETCPIVKEGRSLVRV
jgi:hypothetical protein